ncbi:hypothetical protein [Acidipropionibacterium virtanenii]|uniref:Uncharacterized protein n=1 Tax=Acidipropionibacterium virtanenii TaxID=2057246 RepID=A0A344UT48_9ACTN|nr:hypothetical protein [Acidipropionibacterium virtanenii]AXE38446.1 hypothetical protein JS278_01270 [Acidipropionibacterium virtanenii]
MASIEDLKYAARTVANNAEYIQVQSRACADTLKRHGDRLGVVGKGSRTILDARQRVAVAQRAVEQSAATLLTLRSNVDRFIAEIGK